MYGLTTLKRLNKENIEKKRCLCAAANKCAANESSIDTNTGNNEMGNVNEDDGADFEVDPSHMVRELHKGDALAKLGYFRINLHFTMTNDEFNYVIDCVKFIAKHGWKFSVLYRIDPKSGLYIHQHQNTDYLSLNSFALGSESNGSNNNLVGSGKQNFKIYLEKAEMILKHMKLYMPRKEELSKNEELLGDSPRFYWLPSELYDDVKRTVVNSNENQRVSKM